MPRTAVSGEEEAQEMEAEKKRFHSVRLEKDKCRGCTNCLKRCPTEAIRVRGRRATILPDRCIDCGSCAGTCPVGAISQG